MQEHTEQKKSTYHVMYTHQQVLSDNMLRLYSQNNIKNTLV